MPCSKCGAMRRPNVWSRGELTSPMLSDLVAHYVEREGNTLVMLYQRNQIAEEYVGTYSAPGDVVEALTVAIAACAGLRPERARELARLEVADSAAPAGAALV